MDKILIIYPKIVKKYGEYAHFPIGLAYLASVLKKANFTVKFENLNHSERPFEDIQSVIRNYGPDIIVTGGLSVHYNALKKLISIIKDTRPSAIVIVGGGAATATPRFILDSLEPDIVVIGEGERTLVDVVSSLNSKKPLEQVHGIAFKNEFGEFIITPKRSPEFELDTIPAPDYKGCDLDKHLLLQKPLDHHLFHTLDHPRGVEIISSRSCPYSCTFCFHPLGNIYRQRSLDNVFSEIEFLVENFHINALAIVDEMFANDEKRVVEFCKRIRPFKLKWMVQLRVDSVSGDLLKEMRDAGCVYISYGLESIHPKILKSMKKRITPKQIEKALKLSYEYNIGIQGNFIFGDIEETKETYKSTLAWWKKNRRYAINLSFIQCYPGSKIFKYALEQKIITDIAEFHKQNCPLINITKMPQHEYHEMLNTIRQFRYYIYPGKLISVKRVYPDDPTRGKRYKIKCQCPHCNNIIVYGNLIYGTYPFGRKNLRLSCRSCNQRFDLPSWDELICMETIENER